MTHVLTIETQNEIEFAQIKGLAEQLGVSVKESHSERRLSEAEELELLNRVAGSWAGEETGDELNAMIRSARADSGRDIEL